MTGAEVEFPGCGGLAGIDFGGSGQNVLLVHGDGQNAAAWGGVAQRLVTRCHVIAVDLRGHGQTRLDSTGPEQYWRDLADIVTALGWDRPILVGQAIGGYAVTAVTAAGLVSPAAICVVDGFVLDRRTVASETLAALLTAEAIEELRTAHRYGWTASEEDMLAYVEQVVENSAAGGTSPDAGARQDLIREVTRRSFVNSGQQWTRRPGVEEVIAVNTVDQDAEIFPSVDVYKRVQCPMTMVLAGGGPFVKRRDEIRTVVNTRLNRSLVGVMCTHNVAMAHPSALTDIIVNLAVRYRK